ncbi:MAG: hypothetical protein QM657_04045 [Lacrimispora sp.]|uniref:hypothetical protein n=1 Tax=Lacrimispora sp. TaxID=2719234 RepID=UPI0039E2D983
MKREKRTIWILLAEVAILLFFFILCPLYLYLYGHFSYSEKKAYEMNWEISLPDQIKLVNDKNTTSFHGDGFRHTIYQVEKMEDLRGFEVEKRKEIEDFCIEVFDILGVEAKYDLDFTQKYIWKKYVKHNNNILVIIYFSDKKELHLFQKLV